MMSKKWFFYWITVFILFLCSGELGAAIFGFGTIVLVLDVMIILFALIAVPIGISICLVRKKTIFLKYSLANIVITVLLMFLAVWIPTKGLTNALRGRPTLVALYEGTQNQAVLTLRENNNFDIWWTGVFGYSKYFKGEFELKGDEFQFHFAGDSPHKFNGNGTLLHGLDGSMVVRFFRDDQDTVYRSHDFLVDKLLSNKN